MEDEEEKTHVIIDNGSYYSKIGLIFWENNPSVIRTFVGYPKYKGEIIKDKKEYYIGYQTEDKTGVLNYVNPIKRGEIADWDNMVKIWGAIFTNELRIAPEEHNLLLTEPLLNPKENRQKSAEILFETFNIQGLYFAIQPSLPIYAIGKFTGIVLDLGDGLNSFCPMVEGFIISDATNCLDLSGSDLTENMQYLLNKTGKNFHTDAEKEIVRTIKEKACYVAQNFNVELESIQPYEHVLPDGSKINIKEERIICPEALFKPILINRKAKGIDQLCNDSIQKCDMNVKKILYNNIILSGGTSMLKGLKERLTNEIQSLVPEAMKNEVKIDDSQNRQFLTWKGAQVLVSVSTFESKWITRNEYQEKGPKIFNEKCL